MTAPAHSGIARSPATVERPIRPLRRWGGAALLLTLALGTAAMAREAQDAEDPALALSGIVLDHHGRGVHGAKVSIRGTERIGSPTSGLSADRPLVTDAEGAFSWTATVAGAYIIHVTADGFLPAEKEVATGRPASVVLLSPILDIRGVVRDAATGKPLPGIAVTAVAEEGLDLGSFGRQVVSAADGSFVVRGLGPGRHRVEAGAGLGAGREDYAPAFIPGVRAGTADLRVEMTRGLTIGGRVVGEDGRPVAGKVVTVEPRESSRIDLIPSRRTRFTRWMRTDADGRFRLAGLRPGLYMVRAGGGSPPEDEFFAWARHDIPAGREDLEIRLRKGTFLRGRVLDADGKHVAVGPVQEGWLHVEVRREGKIPEDDPTLDNHWSPDLPRGSGAVQHFENAWFLAGGKFERRLVVPGATYEVVAHHRDGRAGRTRGVPAGAEDAEVRIRPGGSIEGVLLDMEGKPVPAGVPVMAFQRSGHYPFGGGSAETDEGGRFRLSNLHADSFEIRAGGGFSEFVETAVPGEWKPGGTFGEFRLGRGQVVKGRIVDLRRLPRGRVRVIRASSPESWGCATVAEDGTFAIRCLPPGRVHLSGMVEGVHLDGTTFGHSVEFGPAEVPSTGVEVFLR